MFFAATLINIAKTAVTIAVYRALASGIAALTAFFIFGKRKIFATTVAGYKKLISTCRSHNRCIISHGSIFDCKQCASFFSFAARVTAVIGHKIVLNQYPPTTMCGLRCRRLCSTHINCTKCTNWFHSRENRGQESKFGKGNLLSVVWFIISVHRDVPAQAICRHQKSCCRDPNVCLRWTRDPY